MEMLSNFSTADAFSNESSFQPLISAATAHVIETTVQVGVLPVVVVTGATLNVINMAVFVRQGLTDRINLCLFSLSMSDTGYILFLLASRMYSVFQLVDPGLAEYWKVG
ncbi:hypothetical protein BaRGS_00026988 [Batillaria attramentaria]|uniref:G-protein coupled receptors family 1 profile domain-containing protein n=1 Tax=Batillaria attramentaria TaxID=370345 RepID=A0ABD0K497_9CAEN